MTALGLSMREHILRKYAPRADLLLRSAAPARRKVWAARLAQRLVWPLITLPPVIFVPGHRPSQEVKCLMVPKRDMSTPISETTASAPATRSASQASMGEPGKAALARSRVAHSRAIRANLPTGFDTDTALPYE